jgi:hypothetical protein
LSIDIPSNEKRLLLKLETEDPTFLDFNIIVSADHRHIKTTWHNKNSNITTTNFQNVGRFPSAAAPTILAHKTNTIANMLTRAYMCTMYVADLLTPTADIIFEARLLGFSNPCILRVLHMAYTRCPCTPWLVIASYLQSFEHSN